MRVAICAEGDEFGGADISLVNLIRNCPQHDLVLVGPRCASIEGIVSLTPDVEVFNIDAVGSLVPDVRRYRAAFRSIAPDVVQVTLGYPNRGVAPQLAGFSTGAPTIAIEQLVGPLGRRSTPLKWMVSQCLSDHVAVGEASARQTETLFGLSDGSVRTIYNGVPDRNVMPLDLGPGPIVGSVGRLASQKGYDRLIAAMPMLPGWRLVLVGDGDLRETLSTQAAELGVADRVDFLGWRSDPGPYLAAFDVFALPSRNEAFPLSIVEAMLTRVPVVAADVGSVAESVRDGSTGYLVSGDDPAELAKQIEAAHHAVSVGELAIVNQAQDLARRRFTDVAMAGAYQQMWDSPRGRFKSLGVKDTGRLFRERMQGPSQP